MKYIKNIFVICFTVVFLFFGQVFFANGALAEGVPVEASQSENQSESQIDSQSENQSESSEGENIDIPEIIAEHIGDSYEWHITNIGKKSIAIYLPVIVHSSTGWHIFSSKRLHENNGEYEGLHIATAESDYAGKLVEYDATGAEIKPFDISITKNVLSLMISSLILVLLILSVSSWYRNHDPEKETPTGFAAIMEPVIMLVHNDIVKDSIGEDYKKYSPYLCTAFFFILINNLMGLVPIFPGGANLTGNIAITMVLALFTFLAINLFGNKHYYKDIFWPDMPWFLKAPLPIMPVIEIFSTLTKPFSLMVRLFANILAGHIIAISLVCMIFIFAKFGAAMGTGLGVATIALGIFMDFLEILVAFIQAYVFTILSAIFIGMSRQTE